MYILHVGQDATLHDVLPASITVLGRILPKDMWKYISSTAAQSTSKEVLIARLGTFAAVWLGVFVDHRMYASWQHHYWRSEIAQRSVVSCAPPLDPGGGDDDDDGAVDYVSMHSYFHSRRRCGVIGCKAIRSVKDMYLVPVSATTPLPDDVLRALGGRGTVVTVGVACVCALCVGDAWVCVGDAWGVWV